MSDFASQFSLDDFRIEKHLAVPVQDLPTLKGFDYGSWGEWQDGELVEIRADGGDRGSRRPSFSHDCLGIAKV